MIYLLHGFLGQPDDWKGIIPNDEAYPIDLYHSDYPLPSAGIAAWAESFCRTIPKNSSNILVGYSLGGRLALACLKADPSLWKKAVFLSTHPGLTTPHERETRLQNDTQWAKAFRTTPWKRLLNEWNNQTIFGDHAPSRKEANYSRQTLAETLVGWSLAKQDDYRKFLSEVECPLTWITGEQDTKFTELASQLTFAHPQSRSIVIPDASHRLLWNSPESLSCIRVQFYF